MIAELLEAGRGCRGLCQWSARRASGCGRRARARIEAGDGGALTTGMDRGVHPTRLKHLGRHKSYAVLDEYLELGDPFDSHPLSGVL